MATRLWSGQSATGTRGYHDFDTQVGAAYLFKRNSSGVWAEQRKYVGNDRLNPPNPATYTFDSDYFGFSVTISGDRFMIGSYSDDERGVGAGAVYYGILPATGAGSLGFDSAAYAVAESGIEATVTVHRTGGTQGEVSVTYATSDGAATAGADYTAAAGTLIFADGETEKTFTIALNNDSDEEPSETIQITLSDATGGAALGTTSATVLTITDDDQNAAPSVTGPADQTSAEGDTVTLPIAASDPDGDALTFNATNLPPGLTIDPITGVISGTLGYASASTYPGITVAVTDSSLTSSVSFNWTVTNVNRAPTADAASTTTDEDAGVQIILAASDPDGDTLAYAIVSGPEHGGVTLSNGVVTYTPAFNYNGPDSFTFKASDGTDDSNAPVVSITVNPVNDAPEANGDNYTTGEDTTLSVPAPGLLSNDTDVDGDAVTLEQIVTMPAHGTLGCNGDGAFTYTPVPNYNGPDGFTYRAKDGSLALSNVGTVSLNVKAVNDAPNLAGDSVSTDEDTPVSFVPLSNDSDADGDALVIASTTQGAHGLITLHADGSVTYAPQQNFNGADSFTYTVSDGRGGDATATVSVSVGAVNDAPMATNDAAAVAEDGRAINIAVLANDTDVESSALTVTSASQPSHGATSISPDGTTIAYTPAPNFFGTDTFVYSVSDGGSGSVTATVTISVTPVNDAPAAAADQCSVGEDATLTAPASSVLANDGDIDSPVITAVLASGTSNGTLTLNSDGSFAYTPNANFNGADSFTYAASDGSLASAPVTVTILVAPAPDAPVLATVGNQTIAEGSLLALTLSASDPDGETLNFSVTGLPSGAAFDPAAGAFSWTPGYDQAGSYTLSFTVTDPTGLTASETLTITVADVAQNLGPVCSRAYPSIGEIWPPNHSRTEVINIFGVHDPDGDPLTLMVRRVLQDEPTNTLGDGNTWIDGGGVGTPRAWVRAERSGSNRVPGNGRVYEIFFDASDGRGKSCTGSVKVSVPHDQGNKKGVAIDDGKRYDPTVAGGPCLNCNN